MSQLLDPAQLDPPTSPKPGRRADIQGLRAIAVIAVVAYHAGFGFSGGYVGVDVFFVISGYVITRMLAADMQATGRIDLKQFYLRRARRLLPALAVMLSVTLLLSALLAPISAHQSISRTGMSAGLFNANNYLALFGVQGGYFEAGAQANSLLHTWSLSVEEQFYFVVPALLMLSWWFGLRSGRRHLTAWLLTGLVAVSLTLSLVLEFVLGDGGGGRPHQLAFYASPARAWEFAVGGLLALAAGRLSTMRSSVASVSVLAGGVMVGASMLMLDESTRFPGVVVLVPVLGTALMIAGGEPSRPGPISRLLGVRPMQRIGDLSYSWYLWHWPFIVFAAALLPATRVTKPAAAVLGLLVAVVSYRWIENPIRHRTSPPRRTLALAGVCIVAPLLAGVVLEVATRRLSTVPVFAEFDKHLDVEEGCDREVPPSDRDPDTCRWAPAEPKGTVVLVGDSNAGHFTEAVVGAAGTLSLEAQVVTNSACPFVPLQLWVDGERDVACEEFVEGTTRALIESSPDVVVLSSASDGYIGGDRWRLAETDGELLSDPDAKAAAWARALGSLLTDLRSAGIEVVVVHPVPKFGDWKPWKMAPVRLLGPRSMLAVEFDRAGALERRRRAVETQREAASAGGATVLDVFDDICPRDPCSSWGPGFWRYRDNTHISVGQAELLVDRFEEVLGRLVNRS